MAQTKLEQTKGKAKLRGIVSGMDNENSFREGTTSTDKLYKSLSFFVETSEGNKVKVEMFGMERDTVVAYNMNEKDKKKAKKIVSWDDRFDNHGKHKVLGSRMKIELSGNKLVEKQLVEYDAIDYIREHLKDGDSVFVTTNINFSTYTNQQGEEKEQTQFSIQSVTKTKDPVDFDAEDFKEQNGFEQEIVVWDTEVEEKRLLIFGKAIDYRGEHVDTQLIVDGEKYPKLAKNMKSRLSLGDFIQVFGLVINKTEMVEAEEEDDMGDDDDWGGDKDVTGMENNFIRNYIQELQVTSVDSSSYEPSKYTEADFFSAEEDNFGGDDFGDEGDDFGDDGDFGDDDDDLPF